MCICRRVTCAANEELVHIFSQALSQEYGREKKKNVQGHSNIFTINFDSAVGHFLSSWLLSSPRAGVERNKGRAEQKKKRYG